MAISLGIPDNVFTLETVSLSSKMVPVAGPTPPLSSDLLAPGLFAGITISTLLKPLSGAVGPQSKIKLMDLADRSHSDQN